MKNETFTPDRLPKTNEEESNSFQYQSIPVLGLMKNGNVQVVFARQYFEEPDEKIDPSKVKWFTDCSETWDITDYIKKWMYLPKFD
jgi:hypothetical protein